MQGHWQQLTARIRQKWAKVTEEDLVLARGDRDYLLARLQEYYGLARDRLDADLQVLGYPPSHEDVTARHEGESERLTSSRIERHEQGRGSSPRGRSR